MKKSAEDGLERSTDLALELKVVDPVIDGVPEHIYRSWFIDICYISMGRQAHTAKSKN